MAPCSCFLSVIASGVECRALLLPRGPWCLQPAGVTEARWLGSAVSVDE